jgi:hypothetical protein
VLTLIAFWAVSGLAFYIIGAPILSVSGMQACLARTEDRIFLAIWLGIVILANLLLLTSLLMPLTLYVAAPVVMLALSPPLLRRSKSLIADFSVDRKSARILLAVVLAAALFLAFSRDSFYDTGLYHHQMVNWLSEYGSVPGLALIHNRFGFTSSWFALIAPVQTGMLKDRLITGMNSFVFVLMLLQATVVLRRLVERRAGTDDWFFVFAFALFSHYFFSDLIYSLSPDLPAAYLVLVVTWLIVIISINHHWTNKSSANSAGMVVLMLAAGTISIKLSLAPLLAVAIIYYLFAEGPSLSKVLVAVAIITPFLAILMSVSTVTSGCPLYPAPYLCTNLPWSLGSENARNMSSVILDFAKWVGPAPPDATGFDWVWRDPPNSNVFNDKPLMKWLLLANVLCPAWLYLRRGQIGKRLLLFASLVAYAGIIFTLMKAPNLRFGLSYFLIIPALTCVSLLQGESGHKHGYTIQRQKHRMLLLLAALFAVVPLFETYKNLFWKGYQADTILVILIQFADQWELWPAHPILPRELISARTNDVEYSYAADSLCWGAQVPCATARIGGDVWLRDEGAGLSGGFVKKITRQFPGSTTAAEMTP